jgi:hypothetical protein
MTLLIKTAIAVAMIMPAVLSVDLIESARPNRAEFGSNGQARARRCGSGFKAGTGRSRTSDSGKK